jgi:hypothetical protein
MINNPYSKLQQLQAQQAQQYQQYQQPQSQQQQITPEMQQISMQTEIGQKSWQEWAHNERLVLNEIIRQTPSGAIAWQALQDGLIKGYNHYIVSNIQQQNNNNNGLSEIELLKKQLAERDAELAEAKNIQQIAIQQPPVTPIMKGNNK